MSAKRLFASLIIVFAALFTACTKDSLEGTKWISILPDDEGQFELEFTSSSSVVLIGRESDGTIEGKASGTYTYSHPIVEFSLKYSGMDNKFKTKIDGSKMTVIWFDEDTEIDIEGKTFTKQ